MESGISGVNLILNAQNIYKCRDTEWGKCQIYVPHVQGLKSEYTRS